MGGRSVSYLQSVALERDLNLRSPDYTSSTPNHKATPPVLDKNDDDDDDDLNVFWAQPTANTKKIFLSFSDAFNLTAKSLEEILKLEKLTHLSLSRCYSIPPAAFR